MFVQYLGSVLCAVKQTWETIVGNVMIRRRLRQLSQLAGPFLDYFSYLEEDIFKCAGMTQTGFYPPESDVPNRARRYSFYPDLRAGFVAGPDRSPPFDRTTGVALRAVRTRQYWICTGS